MKNPTCDLVVSYRYDVYDVNTGFNGKFYLNICSDCSSVSRQSCSLQIVELLKDELICLFVYLAS